MTHQQLLQHVKGMPACLFESSPVLRKATVEDVLREHDVLLLRAWGNISWKDLKLVKKKASLACAPSPRTALELWETQNCLRTSHEAFDKVLYGGLHSGTVTEIVGPCGVGKTQFCLFYSALTCMPLEKGGLNGSVIYVDTESAFNAKRLSEIFMKRFPTTVNKDNLVNYMNKVLRLRPASVRGLAHIIKHLERDIVRHDAKLIIVDSMASLVRGEMERSSRIELVSMLAEHAALLKQLAAEYNIPVIVTNQVTTKSRDNGTACNRELESGDPSEEAVPEPGFYVGAALGNTWSHCVNTRIILQYNSADESERQLVIAKSPVAPSAGFCYILNDRGPVIQGESGVCYPGTDPGLQRIKPRPGLATADS